jgi:hypothetical protein
MTLKRTATRKKLSSRDEKAKPEDCQRSSGFLLSHGQQRMLTRAKSFFLVSPCLWFIAQTAHAI